MFVSIQELKVLFAFLSITGNVTGNVSRTHLVEWGGDRLGSNPFCQYFVPLTNVIGANVGIVSCNFFKF